MGAKSEVLPNKGKQNQKWLHHPCLLQGPKKGGNATSPLHSRGSPNKGEQNQKWLPHPYLFLTKKKGGVSFVPKTLNLDPPENPGGLPKLA